MSRNDASVPPASKHTCRSPGFLRRRVRLLLVRERRLRGVSTKSGPSTSNAQRARTLQAGVWTPVKGRCSRHLFVERARRRQSGKYGGAWKRTDASPDELPEPQGTEPLELLAVHEALDRLAARSPRKAELVKLRYFLGCTIPEAAELLGIAPATAEEDWTFARAWLRKHLEPGD